jgi:hypothetical protein
MDGCMCMVSVQLSVRRFRNLSLKICTNIWCMRYSDSSPHVQSFWTAEQATFYQVLEASVPMVKCLSDDEGKRTIASSETLRLQISSNFKANNFIVYPSSSRTSLWNPSYLCPPPHFAPRYSPYIYQLDNISRIPQLSRAE